MRRRGKRYPQSQLESQNAAANARYVAWLKRFPADYPKPARALLPRYEPWPSALPRYTPANKSPALNHRLERADLRLIKRRDGSSNVIGSIKPKPYVLSSFDARPINCIDFLDTFSAGEVVGDVFTGSYIVPPGRVAIFRNLSLRVYMSVLGRDAVTGAPVAALTMNIFVSAGVVDQVNNIRVDDAICTPTFSAPLVMPLYFLAPPEAVLTLQITNATAAMDITTCAPMLSGNLLLAEGVNPTSEPGTHAPLPVRG